MYSFYSNLGYRQKQSEISKSNWREGIYAIRRLTTSPKASKGKPGIRPDINPSICFYSTWEANVARVFNLVGIKWQYGPKIFDLGQHTYRPDFYLPTENIYRDKEFHEQLFFGER
jgi:hypothetical protein